MARQQQVQLLTNEALELEEHSCIYIARQGYCTLRTLDQSKDDAVYEGTNVELQHPAIDFYVCIV